MFMPKKDSVSLLSTVSKIFPWVEQDYVCRIYMSRRIVKMMTVNGQHFYVGWLHDPVVMPPTQYALGIFSTPKGGHFVPIAKTDTDGHIYEIQRITDSIEDKNPRVIVAVEGEGKVRQYHFNHQPIMPTTSTSLTIKHGAVVVRAENGTWRWMASFLKFGKRYTFEQLRSPSLSPRETADLSLPHAMAIAYFMIYVQPTLALDTPRVIGFGTSHIYRRLRHQAPLSAIRLSQEDIDAVRAAHLRVSALEEYFSHTMKESGAFERIPRLEAKHAQENLELMTNPKSHLYYLHSRDGVDFDAALKTLRIESNLNRFSSLSSVIENNYHYNFMPTEDTVTLPYVARLSEELLENPAFDAFSTLDTNGVHDPDAQPMLRYTRDDDSTVAPESSFTSQWLGQFYAQTQQQLPQREEWRLDNIDRINAVYPMVKAARETAYSIAMNNNPYASDPQTVRNHGAHSSQWVYRQAMAKLISYLRLPIRSDIDFRADVEKTRSAVIDFTSMASTSMPLCRFDAQHMTWVDVPETERQAMSSRYNLRVGIILAALAFGASDNIDKVAVRIDSLDSSQDLEDRDPTMYALLMRALEKMGMDNPSASAATPAKDRTRDRAERSDRADRTERTDRSDRTDSTSDHSVGSGAGESDKDSSEASSTSDRHDNEAFMDIMQSANFTQDQINAFRAYNSEPTDAEVNELFNAVTSNESSNSANSSSGSPSPLSIVSGPGTDPLELIRSTALNNTVAAVVFERKRFMELLQAQGLTNPYEFYRSFDYCVLDTDFTGVLKPVETSIDIRDSYFSPEGSQDEPEISRTVLTPEAAEILGGKTAQDLSIQRSDVLERAQEDIADFAQKDEWTIPERAQKISEYIDELNDPELNGYKDSYLRSVIDETPIDRNRFTLSNDIDDARDKSRDIFMSGRPDEALTFMDEYLDTVDAQFKTADRVSVYFNSYPERVVYNRLHATEQEKLVLIPDNLFRSHLELVEVYTQLGQRDKALKHVNLAVSYAPVYAYPHLRLSVMLAEDEDWQSSFAAAHNALLVALDKNDAAYAYYRMAYAAWMQDEFVTAAACYIMSIHISENVVPHAREEYEDLSTRAQSQDIALPHNPDEAADALMYNDIDLWPFTDAVQLMAPSAKIAVDNNLFVAARALAIAATNITSAVSHMDEEDNDALYIVQSQFLRSLNA